MLFRWQYYSAVRICLNMNFASSSSSFLPCFSFRYPCSDGPLTYSMTKYT